MTEAKKEIVRNVIANDSAWIVVDGILGQPVSALDWGKDCEIIYEDMDGDPVQCRANYNRPSMGGYFRAIDGPAKGNRMCNVIAYRPIKEAQE